MSKKQIKNHFDINLSKSLIGDAIINYIFKSRHFQMPDEIFKIFLKYVISDGLDGLDDYSLLSDQRIRNIIDWKDIPRKKLIRLFTRDTSIIDEIDFDKMNFTILELEGFLKFHPQFIGQVYIDFENITPKEVLIVLFIDKDAHELIDFDQITFSRLELFKMVKRFVYDDEILNKLNFNQMDNFMYRHILIKTKDKHIDKINLTSLNILDWLSVLQHCPTLFDYCDLSIFTQGDCYYLTKLAEISNDPKIFELIKQNKNNIGSLGWQNLLMIDFEKYSPLCNWTILKNSNFKKLKSKYPDIEKYQIS